MSVKIAIMGTSGTGKTTLVKALAREFNVPIIEESFSDIFEKIDEIRKNENKKSDLALQIKDLLDQLRSWITKRAQAIRENDGFVCDRTSIDILEILLSSNISFNDKMIVGLLKEIRLQLKALDLIVVLPMTHNTFKEPTNEMGINRSMGLQHKLHGQSIKIGLLAMLSPTPTLLIENQNYNVEDRISVIKKRLSHIKG